MSLEKILKKLPQAVVEEMNAAEPKALAAGIVQSEKALVEAKEGLDANSKYQDARENVKALSQSFRELKSYQTAKIQYALLRLKELGK